MENVECRKRGDANELDAIRTTIIKNARAANRSASPEP